MVQLTRIYTKGGDKGKTSLGSGKRVLKSSLRIQAIGDVDEANALIGVACLYVGEDLKKLLKSIQNTLFDCGADLCVPAEEENALRISAQRVDALEKQIDSYNQHLEPLTSFVLPGGTEASAYLHQARVVTRRAERSLVALMEEEQVNENLLKYLNRLSDLIFVLARFENDKGKLDVLWEPGGDSA